MDIITRLKDHILRAQKDGKSPDTFYVSKDEYLDLLRDAERYSLRPTCSPRPDEFMGVPVRISDVIAPNQAPR